MAGVACGAASGLFKIFVPKEGKYKVVLSSDDGTFGGQGRVDATVKYNAESTPDGWFGFKCYLPQRSAFVLKKTK